MVGSVLSSCAVENGLLDKLLAVVARDRTVWGPTPADDGSWRLQVVEDADTFPTFSQLTRLSIKKLLLPHREAVWNYRGGRYQSNTIPPSILVFGVPLCDLQALWYLDRVFAEDAHYLERRANIFVSGAPCQPGQECRCAESLMPLAGDLFVDQDRVWALSEAGADALRSAGGSLVKECTLPWPEGTAEKRCTLTEKQFHAKRNADTWNTEGTRCLSCGACSAVCPTCYCFDLLDVASTDGTVTRERAWDNCFFAEHGQVAGGFDFRPGRAERLRFRMEHKRLGFGDLKGQDSCVGCGRCRSACPVDIDLDTIIKHLVGEVNDG